MKSLAFLGLHLNPTPQLVVYLTVLFGGYYNTDLSFDLQSRTPKVDRDTRIVVRQEREVRFSCDMGNVCAQPRCAHLSITIV